MRYRYVAYSTERLHRGRITAESPGEAETAIARQGYRVLSLRRLPQPPTVEELFPTLFRVSKGEVVQFCRQLATLLGTGITLTRALELVQSHVKNRVLRRVLTSVVTALNKGESFSAAVAQHPRVFNSLLQQVIAVAEHTGQLSIALKQIATLFEREDQARKKAMRALMYPGAVMLMAVGTMVILFTVALPPLLTLFESFDAQLPMATRIAVMLANIMQKYFMYIMLGLLVVTILGILALRRPRGRYLRDRLLLRLPVVGSIIVAHELARFSRSTSMLLQAGVNAVDIMRLIVEASGNLVLKRVFEEAERDMLAGGSLSASLARNRAIPPMFVQMVLIGEESGTLDTALANTADVYEQQTDEKMGAFLSLLEPLTTVGIALMIGFIAYSMFVPIYSGLGNIE